MKANFKIKKNNDVKTSQTEDSEAITEKEFENYVSKAGAAGTFMVFRSDKKEDELGIEEL